jgi:hypothetical protein
MPATYTAVSLFFGRLKSHKTKWILAGLTLIGIGGFFMGPTSYVTKLDKSLSITLVAYGVLGVAASPV